LLSGGGKGGCLLAFSKDRRFIVKELSAGDHQTLLALTRSLVERMHGAQTLLCTIYMHYTDAREEHTLIVMRNILQHPGPYVGLYDLKGCDDDKTIEARGEKVKAVRKRFWNLEMHLGQWTWSKERLSYYMGKLRARHLELAITAKQRAEFMNLLRFDTNWLASKQLMDYSLLVGVKRMSQEEFYADAITRHAFLSTPDQFCQPLISRAIPQADGGGRDDVMLVYVGIIDFLETWSAPKMAARAVKFWETKKATIPPKPYAQRFFDHFDSLFKGSAVPLDGAAATGSQDDQEVVEGLAEAAPAARSLPWNGRPMAAPGLLLSIEEGSSRSAHAEDQQLETVQVTGKTQTQS